MESLQIRTGSISLRILDDLGNERGIFTFNPEDVKSAEQLLLLQQDLNVRSAELEQREKDAKNNEEKIALMNEVVQYFRDAIDRCFGEGSSDILFGNSNTLSMFYDFIEGITPYYKKASDKRKAKYGKKQK